MLFSVAALSKPHLFENRGHNRQGSDSSVDRFIPKEEPAEPEPDNKVPPVFIYVPETKKCKSDDYIMYVTVPPVFSTVAVAN